MSYKGAPSLPYSKLGNVEDGTTASKAYNQNDYIIWMGDNYFAKTDILQGETFVVDTNLTAIPDGVINGIVARVDNLSDHLAKSIRETNYITVANTSPSHGEVVTEYRIGNMLFLSFWVDVPANQVKLANVSNAIRIKAASYSIGRFSSDGSYAQCFASQSNQDIRLNTAINKDGFTASLFFEIEDV